MKPAARATAGSGGGGGVGVLAVWLAGHFGLAMSAEVGALVATLLAGVGAAVAHKGIRGLAVQLWRGSGG